MELRKTGYLLALFIASIHSGYSQTNNCEPCQEALQYKQQFDNWFTNIYNNWNTSLYINRRGDESVQIVDNHALWVNFLNYDAGKMNDHARINYLRRVRRSNPDKNNVYNAIITQRNAVGYRGDTRRPEEIIAAGGYYPNRNGQYGQADDMVSHIDNMHSGSFVSTSGKFSVSVLFASDMDDHPSGTLVGWVAEFRYSCRNLNIGGVESVGEVLTSHIPLDHIICWIPIRAGTLPTGLNCDFFVLGDEILNIDYVNTYWNPYYKGDKYWNPQGRPAGELFDEPMPLQLNQGHSPVPGNVLMHQLKCNNSVEVVPFGIFQKKHRIAMPVSGATINNHYYNAVSFDAGLHVAIGIEYLYFDRPVIIQSGTSLFVNTCTIQFSQNCIIERGARLIIYPTDPREPLTLSGIKVYAGSKGYIDLKG